MVLVEHSDPMLNARHRLWQLLRRASYPHAAMVVSVSQNIDRYFTWLPESKKEVIPNPVLGINAKTSVQTDLQDCVGN